MSYRNKAVQISVWLDSDENGERIYSISLEDDQDNEVSCIGGADNYAAAWEQACAEGEARSLPVRGRRYETADEDKWDPEPSEEDEE